MGRSDWSQSAILCGVALLATIAASGCSRRHYRLQADQQAMAIVGEKAAMTPWAPGYDYSIQPDPRSRLFDASLADDPELPPPFTPLYSYHLPPLGKQTAHIDDLEEIPAPAGRRAPGARLEALEPPDPSELLPPPEPAAGAGHRRHPVHVAGFEVEDVPETVEKVAPAEATELPERADFSLSDLRVIEIPQQYWDSVPPSCLARMLEFESVREEYGRTYESAPTDAAREHTQKLDLKNLVELGLLNSREYQTQKERLYRAALALTLQRYDYQTRFTATGNGTDVDFIHSRNDGRTVNTLRVPTAFGMERMLATGGNVVARFANDVVLTFNGPSGFASDVSSELLFDLTQSVLQRDVLLNPLIQSERDVVYAARDYARFRKIYFVDLAAEYYSLLVTYRQIEINAQNYFSLVRALNQAEAEVRAGIQSAPSRIQIEQIEQSMLQGRSRLITTCTNLERRLDSLKLTLGLPTELPLNLDLEELEQLTLRDQVEVTGELVRRARQRVIRQREKQPAVAGDLLSAGIVLSERLLEWLDLREESGQSVTQRDSIQQLRADFRFQAAQSDALLRRSELQRAHQSQPQAPPLQLFQRTMDLVELLLTAVERQAELEDALGLDVERGGALRQRLTSLRKDADQLRQELAAALQQPVAQRLQQLLAQAEQLLERAELLWREAAGLDEEAPLLQVDLQRMLQQTQQLMEISQQLLEEARLGLEPVDISVDNAMLTALSQRLDLMNQRGALADQWRLIKITADDLKSVLNLNATQSIRTPRNRPFDFGFDDSQTRLRMSLDLPLNRRAQRNSYRRALIDYQRARRDLMGLEDNIKFQVRDGMRDLELTRVQYPISVASAALAAERVFSTQFELALGLSNVQARDFLEAQDAFQEALTRVASDRIGYIVDRARFALDLELLMLNDEGYWPEIRDPRYQPQPQLLYPPDAGLPYGKIPEFLKVSPQLRRMVQPEVTGGPLFVPKSLDGVHGGGPARRVHAEDDADAGRDAEG